MAHVDTIVAAATPPGRGGVGIVRLSGAKVPEYAAVLLGELPQPRRATIAAFRDAAGEPIDVGIALFFPGPKSYTGEHVLELHGHGGPVVSRRWWRGPSSSARAARGRANSRSAPS
jgi:tRNA modification GTPase